MKKKKERTLEFLIIFYPRIVNSKSIDVLKISKSFL